MSMNTTNELSNLTDEQRLQHYRNVQDWDSYNKESDRQYKAKMAGDRAEQREGLIAKGVASVLFHLGWDNDETHVRLSRFLDKDGNVMKFASWNDYPQFDAYCLETEEVWNGTFKYDVASDRLSGASRDLVGSRNYQEYNDEGGYNDATEWYWMDGKGE
jgi:hypothetical protein